MPATRTVTSPSGVKICFDADAHRYYTPIVDDFNRDYMSVTTFVKRFFEPFNADAQAIKTAEKTGKTQEAVKAEWEASRDYACGVGTRVHEVAEDVVNGKPIRHKPKDEHERLLMKQAWLAATKVKADMRIHEAEAIVFDVGTKIAGTADLLAYDKAGSLWILDWKTNVSLDEKSRFGKTGSIPIKHIPDCNVMHYSLQLSTYEYLIRKGGYVSGRTAIKRAIIHLREDGYKVMPLESFGAEIRDMIIFYAIDNVPF